MDSTSPKSALRATMPHVVTQWQAETFLRESSRQLPRPQGSSSDYPKPTSTSPLYKTTDANRHRSGIAPHSASSSEKWDFGSIRHIRQYSTAGDTPLSTAESVFELPSRVTSSPNSSFHSTFVAELEDTSLSPRATYARPRGHSSPVKPSPLSPSTMEFKTSQVASRAVIQVVDETIAAIEATNRTLLSRAEAAEESAKVLREQNLDLQLKIKQYSQKPPRPVTAPSQPYSARRVQNGSPLTNNTSDFTPLSTFNDAIDRAAPIKKRETKSGSQPLLLARRSNRSPSTPLRRPIHVDIAPNPFDNSGFPSPPHYQRYAPLALSPQRPLLHSRCHSANRNPNNMEISTPIPGSVSRHDVTYAGIPLSYAPRAKIISLDEARRRAKPLPPLGPMSPSILKGVVEIGSGPERDWSRSGKVCGFEKRKRGFSGLFKRNKKECIF